MDSEYEGRVPAPWILGFDVGGTKTALIAGTLSGEVLERTSFASQAADGFEPMWRSMVAGGQALVARHGRPLAIGVSIGGPLDTERGIIYSPPNLPGWDAVPLKELLEQTFAVPVYVEHDAKACVLAEWLFGAARGRQNVVFLTFGTGLGAGLILDGRLYRGASGDSGEVGHWRIAADGPDVYGKRGSWEGYSSGAGLAALAAFRFPGVFPSALSAADIVQRARDGDERARQLVRESAAHLGQGLALLIDLLNPEMIVLGSLAVRAGDLFLPIARAVAAAEATRHSYQACAIVAAGLGEQLGDIAPLCAALYRANLPRRDGR